MKKVYPPTGKRCINYWWNAEIDNFRRMTMKSRRKALRAWMRGTNDAVQLGEEFKANKKLARMIKNAKERYWKEFCATLIRDLWGRPYRVIMSRMARRTRTEGLHVDRIRDIVDELFLTRPTGSNDGRSRNLNEGGDVDNDGCRIMVENLRDAGKRINQKKAVGADGIAGTAVRVLIEELEVLRALNAVNTEGKIPAKWKEASVVLIPKPDRDPALTSSFQPTNVLLALSKV